MVSFMSSVDPRDSGSPRKRSRPFRYAWVRNAQSWFQFAVLKSKGSALGDIARSYSCVFYVAQRPEVSQKTVTTTNMCLGTLRDTSCVRSVVVRDSSSERYYMCSSQRRCERRSLCKVITKSCLENERIAEVIAE
jgi:hypothetical protein